jgi:hypothetical protein
MELKGSVPGQGSYSLELLFKLIATNQLPQS